MFSSSSLKPPVFIMYAPFTRRIFVNLLRTLCKPLTARGYYFLSKGKSSSPLRTAYAASKGTLSPAALQQQIRQNRAVRPPVTRLAG
jgi:hypothetical protein